MRGSSSYQDPHISSLSIPSRQHTNENVHSLNVATQVTMRRNLSCYRVFHSFLTPSFVLLGASAKSRRLGKLSHASLLSRQVKTVIFISKITITIKSPILHFGPMRTHTLSHTPLKPVFQKRAKILSFGMPQPLVSIPVATVIHEYLFWPTVYMILSQNLK